MHKNPVRVQCVKQDLHACDLAKKQFSVSHSYQISTQSIFISRLRRLRVEGYIQPKEWAKISSE